MGAFGICFKLFDDAGVELPECEPKSRFKPEVPDISYTTIVFHLSTLMTKRLTNLISRCAQ